MKRKQTKEKFCTSHRLGVIKKDCGTTCHCGTHCLCCLGCPYPRTQLKLSTDPQKVNDIINT